MERLTIKNGIRYLSPVYFALPMSTGIISVASFTLGYERISDILFVINNVELIILSILLLLRLIFFFPEFKEDLSSHAEGAGFLTIVAALCIYGTKNVLLRNNLTAAIAGWSFSFGVWLAIIYSFFSLISIRKNKVSLREGINGSWLLFVVSVQALSISGNTVASHFDYPPQIVLFFTLLFFLLGAIFYLIIISFIFYRMAFFKMEPAEFRPSFWINMGAAAISTLAGATLAKDMAGVTEFQTFIPSMKVLTMFFWISGTWWIPVIAWMEIWKRTKIKVRYFPGYWSLVFPLGVYTVCTWELADVIGLEFLKGLPEVTIYFAWAAWAITYVEMIRHLTKSFFGKKIFEVQIGAKNSIRESQNQ